MSDHKQLLLHERLKEDQEPFKLHSYISEKRSQLKRIPPKTTLQVKKSSNLCKNVCFFSFRNSPDVRKSPLVNFPSPAMSPSKSAAGGVFLHVPSRTAAVLIEAAMRIQKHGPKPKSQSKNVGKGLFGSFLKRLKDRSKNKKRAVGDNEFKILKNNELKQKEIMISCSCNDSRFRRNDLEASTSGCRPEELDGVGGDFALEETRFCSSPFRFSLHRSPSSSGRRTPDFCSPGASPRPEVKQEKEGDLDSAQGEVEKEQCSPVSVLDPFFEGEAHESEDADEEDDDDDNYDLDSTYANVQRAKQQLLNRLRRFEKLAELDPVELERKLLEDNSDDECERESVKSKDNEPLSPYRKQCVEKFVNQVDGKKLHNREIVWGRICNRLIDSWEEAEFSTVDRLVELDFKKEFEEQKEFREDVEEAAGEIAAAIYEVLVEELIEEMFGVVDS